MNDRKKSKESNDVSSDQGEGITNTSGGFDVNELVEVPIPERDPRKAQRRAPLIEWNKVDVGDAITVDITDVREVYTNDDRMATIVRCRMVETYKDFAKGSKVTFFAPANLKRLLSNVVGGGIVRIQYLGKQDEGEISTHQFKLFASRKDMLQPPAV